MADEEVEDQEPSWYQVRKNQQIAAAAATFALMLVLAYSVKWPFHQRPIDLGENPSIWEILLNERVTLGLIRAGLAAIVTYAIVSVPALIVGGRWMKGLTTTGMTADDADDADKGIEDLQSELKTTQSELQVQATENDFLSEWGLQLQAEIDRLQAELDQAQGDEGGG